VWEEDMCALLKAGREAGRRDSIVIVAEGACDRSGQPITSGDVKEVLVQRLGFDTRVTILGHGQRGGAPRAFDRYMSTPLGHAAVEAILDGEQADEASLIGMCENRVQPLSLAKCLELTQAQNKAVSQHDGDA